MLLCSFDGATKFLIALALVATQCEFFGSAMLSMVCTQRQSRVRSRLATYQEWYTKRRWGVFGRRRLSRLNYRWESFIDWYNVNVCCDGFELQGTTCMPVCKSGCKNGFCLTPNNCLCHGHYVSAVINGLGSCVPSCSDYGQRGCGDHGTCVAPNECHCHDGYRSSNDSDRSSPNYPCAPVCQPSCGKNAFCKSPNNCACHAGHTRTEGQKSASGLFACEPSCDPECEIGMTCYEPDKCRCNDGYSTTGLRLVVRKKDGQLRRFPDGEYPEGCVPICDPPCVDGICESPGYCNCSYGYAKTSETPQFVCSPICNPACVKGTCMGPGYCECHPGHAKDPGDWSQACSPVCDPPCVNGTCTSPGHCECHTGYRKDPKSSSQWCWPVCDPPCVNGTCTSPNYCECHTGYRKDPKSSSPSCWPVCEPPCVNGTCSSPNYCECHTGYRKDPKSSSQSCWPVCDPPCVNGTCTSPNYCECHDGHKKQLTDWPQLCSPVCDPKCNENAHCATPGSCLCDSGYAVVTSVNLSILATADPPGTTDASTSSNLSEVICKPVCERDCQENESCVGPNVCQCDPGYRANIRGTGPANCLPICEPPCRNARCEYPNKCACHTGYAPSAIGDHACDPICQGGCHNASCTRPNHCECFDGYAKTSTTVEWLGGQSSYENRCVPSCSGQCVNGTCIAPGQCHCDPGYVLETTLISLTDGTTTDYVENSDSTIASISVTTDVTTVNDADDNDSGSTLTSMTITDEYDGNSTVVSGGFVQFCRPFCEPACPIGAECIAPHRCGPRADGNEESIDSTDRINVIEDCGDNVDYLNENGVCVCKYGWSGRRCERPSLCGLVIEFGSNHRENSTTLRSTSSNNETTEATYDDHENSKTLGSSSSDNETTEPTYDNHENSTTPQSSSSNNQPTEPTYEELTDMRMISSDYDDTGASIDWQGPMCAEDCRIFMTSSEITENTSDPAVSCYLLESERAGVLSMSDRARHPGSRSGRHALRQHMLRHAGKNYKCGLPGCPTVLRTANELRSHRALVHESGSTERQFHCNECSYAAKTRTQLRRHHRKHDSPTEEENPQQLSCPYSNCNFVTKVSSHLTRHIRLHTGTKPYKCRHCKYASNNLENLRKHVLSTSLHPGKTIYECDACRASGSLTDPYCTNFAKELRAHLLEAHPREFPRPSHASDHVASIFGAEREHSSPTPDVNNPYEESITVHGTDHAIKTDKKPRFTT